MPATRRRFSPCDLDDLVDDVIYEITDARHLLPVTRRVRSFRREQRRSGRRFPRQKDPVKVPLPPRTTITFWLLAPPKTATTEPAAIPLPTCESAPSTRPKAA
jgi:hypothetical protein